MSNASHPTPTTIIAGFLGSGKTTIIGHLIDELQAQGQQVAYIKNEVGETDLDAQLLKDKNIQTKELLNGCICCTIIGPFHAAIDELIEKYHPDRIIIEASGTADSAALALTVSTHRGLKRDGVIGVIDVVNFEGYKDLSVTAQNQTKFTDVLVFNKIELVDLARKRAVVGYVRELNNHSPIVEAPNGIVPASVVFGLDERELNALLAHSPSGELHEQLHDHTTTDDITGCTVPIPKAVREGIFTTWLQSLPKNIIRAKGVVRIASTENESVPRMFNLVGNRIDYQAAPTGLEDAEPFIICIGVHADQSKAAVERSLQAL